VDVPALGDVSRADEGVVDDGASDGYHFGDSPSSLSMERPDSARSGDGKSKRRHSSSNRAGAARQASRAPEGSVSSGSSKHSAVVIHKAIEHDAKVGDGHWY
jgi:hypothetical protein